MLRESNATISVVNSLWLSGNFLSRKKLIPGEWRLQRCPACAWNSCRNKTRTTAWTSPQQQLVKAPKGKSSKHRLRRHRLRRHTHTHTRTQVPKKVDCDMCMFWYIASFGCDHLMKWASCYCCNFVLPLLLLTSITCVACREGDSSCTFFSLGHTHTHKSSTQRIKREDPSAGKRKFWRFRQKIYQHWSHYAIWTKNKRHSWLLLSCEDVEAMPHFLLDNVFIQVGGKVFQQCLGIPTGTNCAPLSAELLLHDNESSAMIRFSRTNGHP